MIDDAQRYFHELGLLHDAWLEGFNWSHRTQTIRLDFDDYRAAISENGVPAVQAIVEFGSVSGLRGALDDSLMMISEFEVVPTEGGWKANLVAKSGECMTWNFMTVTATEKSA